VIILVLAGAFGAAAAGEPPLITWMQADTPPFHIGDGQGVKDRQYLFLAAHLPQFRHRQMIASVARNWYELEHADGICIVGVSRTPEREKFTLFSQRPLVGFGTRIVVRRGQAERFKEFLDPQGAVDLVKLAQSPALVGGYVTAMHYGDSVSRFIEDDHRAARLDKFVTPPQLFNVLKAGRLDYIFGQAVEAAYYAKEFGLQPGELKTLKITSSGKGGGGGIGIGCSNGPAGRQVIQAIDALLSDEQMWRDYTAPYSEWSVDKN
jgi:uncharacterized protein (TIGR02285 family)